MDINASIIDQRLNALKEDLREQAREILNINDDIKLKSLAFVYLCVKTVLDLEPDEVFDCLTEGGGDFGVDAIHISEEYDGEFAISLFQAKYKDNLQGNSNFPESGLTALVNAIRYLFDPYQEVQQINERLTLKIEAVRSLIRDGYIPQVRVLACNNGLSGKYLLKDLEIQNPSHLDHRNFEQAVKLIQQKGNTTYFDQACQDIKKALERLYGESYTEISLQQLAATFRRGDLIRKLRI